MNLENKEEQILNQNLLKIENSEANSLQKEKAKSLLNSWTGKGYPGIFQGYDKQAKKALIITPSMKYWSINEAGKID